MLKCFGCWSVSARKNLFLCCVTHNVILLKLKIHVSQKHSLGYYLCCCCSLICAHTYSHLLVMNCQLTTFSWNHQPQHTDEKKEVALDEKTEKKETLEKASVSRRKKSLSHRSLLWGFLYKNKCTRNYILLYKAIIKKFILYIFFFLASRNVSFLYFLFNGCNRNLCLILCMSYRIRVNEFLNT